VFIVHCLGFGFQDLGFLGFMGSDSEVSMWDSQIKAFVYRTIKDTTPLFIDALPLFIDVLLLFICQRYLCVNRGGDRQRHLELVGESESETEILLLKINLSGDLRIRVQGSGFRI
jgi:hypothetical protein